MEQGEILELLKKLISVNGDEYQEKVAIEECSELIQAICHKHRGREHNIAEEIADVEIMLEQLKIINNCRDEVNDFKEIKLLRIKHKAASAKNGECIETREVTK